VVPVRGVERRALERVEAGQVRDRRLAERTRGGDDDVGRVLAAVGRDVPAVARLVPARVGDRAAGPDVRAQVVAIGDVLDVVLDLGLGRVRAAPVRVQGEAEGVQVRGHVALAARIRV